MVSVPLHDSFFSNFQRKVSVLFWFSGHVEGREKHSETPMTELVCPLCDGEWKLHLGAYLYCCALNTT